MDATDIHVSICHVALKPRVVSNRTLSSGKLDSAQKMPKS